MTDREIMEQALDALELLAWYENPATKVQVRKPRNGGPIVTMYPHKVATDAAAPLRERLAQPEKVMAEYKFQTYAAYKTDGEMKIGVVPETRPATREEKIVNPGVYEVRSCAECGKSGGWALYCVECMEKLTQPKQEPVSGVVLDEHGLGALVKNGSEDWHCKNRNARRLYTTPPQGIYYTPPQRTWVGLTDEEILDNCEFVPDYDIGNHDLIKFARANEAKLKEKNT